LVVQGYGAGGWRMLLGGKGEIRALGNVSTLGEPVSGTARLTLCGKGDQNARDVDWRAGAFTIDKPKGEVRFTGAARFRNTRLDVRGSVARDSVPLVLEGSGKGGIRLRGSLTVGRLILRRIPHTGMTTFDFGGGTLTVTEKLVLDCPSVGGWNACFKNGTVDCRGGLKCLRKGAWKGNAVLRLPDGRRMTFPEACARDKTLAGMD
jgi:hypothetical protein